jgi:hypothetical protein
VSPQRKARLAREHFDRAQTAFDAGDLVVAITFLHLAAEAAIVALSDANGIATERQHWRKAGAARELHARGILTEDLSAALELLNQARKDAGYEGETPDIDGFEELTASVQVAVLAADEIAG